MTWFENWGYLGLVPLRAGGPLLPAINDFTSSVGGMPDQCSGDFRFDPVELVDSPHLPGKDLNNFLSCASG